MRKAADGSAKREGRGMGASEIRQQRELQNAKRGKTLAVGLTVNRDEQLCDFHGQGAWRENIV